MAELGQLLFYDKLLSGNRNIACATCHHPNHASSDGLSLGIGEGGTGLGPERRLQDHIKHRVPRNSPALFNLGVNQIHTLFHDGRLREDPTEPGGFNSPAEEFLPEGLDNILAAQALFPMISAVEMAGDLQENEVSGAVRRRADYAWTLIAERVANTPGYGERFAAVFLDIDGPANITIVHIANALAAFISFEWRADDSPFDRFLQGDQQALTDTQQGGMQLFYGKAGCGSCHQGVLQTDQDFHSLGLPQFGPGRTRRFDLKNRDMGRINESDRREDIYRFRTPSLRNVAHTAPYGHNGAYQTLEGILNHHLNPRQALDHYDKDQPLLPKIAKISEQDFLIWADQREQQSLLNSIDIDPPQLTQEERLQLIAFLHALTDQTSLDSRLGIPDSVPSGLPVDR